MYLFFNEYLNKFKQYIFTVYFQGNLDNHLIILSYLYYFSPNLFEKNPKNNPIEPIELHRIFINSINHILSVEPFFSKLKNFPLKKMELDFFQKDLAKNNVDIKLLLDGCLDCLENI